MKESEYSLGALIKSSQISKDVFEKFTVPIVLCSFAPRIKRFIADGKFEELGLNKLLAENLIKKDAGLRPQLAADEAMKIIASPQVPVLLTDYEMLFDPRYKIDVIKFFCELSRRVKIIVKWCGRIDNNHLLYATPAHEDFHSYNIENYDIICVI
ncbi:MAG TPA: BREX-3 system P-loop-containing protein BrxF [Clostridiaceae bacterium]|nr:BREX-3 system P-loop-containing protein BrxF [Clostridiaceae bacterium]